MSHRASPSGRATRHAIVRSAITSWRSGPLAPANPWASKSLEWQTATPVPLENFPVLPVVTTRPYDYGVPDPLAYSNPDSDPATEKAGAAR